MNVVRSADCGSGLVVPTYMSSLPYMISLMPSL